MITILSDDANQDIGKTFYKYLKSQINDVNYISVSHLNINTCLNCGYCTTKEYRKCVLKDDMQDLLYTMAQSEKLILVSPIIFGSYSSKIKKILDRLAILGDVHYHIVNKEMVKGTVIKQNGLYTIGIKENCSPEEKELFLHLVDENVKIINVKGKGVVIDHLENLTPLKQFAEVVINA